MPAGHRVGAQPSAKVRLVPQAQVEAVDRFWCQANDLVFWIAQKHGLAATLQHLLVCIRRRRRRVGQRRWRSFEVAPVAPISSRPSGRLGDASGTVPMASRPGCRRTGRPGVVRAQKGLVRGRYPAGSPRAAGTALLLVVPLCRARPVHQKGDAVHGGVRRLGAVLANEGRAVSARPLPVGGEPRPPPSMVGSLRSDARGGHVQGRRTRRMNNVAVLAGSPVGGRERR
jgi:hypothetical protein